MPRAPTPAPETEARPIAEPSLDDTELLVAVRAGDASAAGALYARARPHVERTVARLLGAHDPDQEDLVQLSLIELVSSIRRFRGECSLDTWISRISAHAVFKEIRRRRSAGRLLASAREMHITAPRSTDLERELSDRNVIARIQGHLEAIDPVKAWTVMLHDVCGYDLREIADITEVSVAAAQSRLVRGRAELHSRIEKDRELADVLLRSEGAP